MHSCYLEQQDTEPVYAKERVCVDACGSQTHKTDVERQQANAKGEVKQLEADNTARTTQPTRNRQTAAVKGGQ